MPPPPAAPLSAPLIYCVGANLSDYIKTHYTGPRVVVAGAGAIEHGSLVKLADAAFGSLPSLPSSGVSVVPDSPGYVGSQIRLRDDDIELAHFAIGFETGGWTNVRITSPRSAHCPFSCSVPRAQLTVCDAAPPPSPPSPLPQPHSFPLMIMQTLLGTWDRTIAAGPNMTSPLCRKAGELNLAHSVTSFNTTYKDTGLFGVYAVSEPTKAWELSCEILFEMVRLCHSVTPDEVAFAKTQLKNALLGGLDGSTTIFEDIGRQMLTYNRRMTPAEIIARIDAVDVAAVKAASRAYIDDKECVSAGVGNVHELPDANYLRRRTVRLCLSRACLRYSVAKPSISTLSPSLHLRSTA